MENQSELSHPVGNYLYFGIKFNTELEKFGVFIVSDLANISLLEILSFKNITVARLRTVVLFMQANNLRFKDCS